MIMKHHRGSVGGGPIHSHIIRLFLMLMQAGVPTDKQPTISSPASGIALVFMDWTARSVRWHLRHLAGAVMDFIFTHGCYHDVAPCAPYNHQ